MFFGESSPKCDNCQKEDNFVRDQHRKIHYASCGHCLCNDCYNMFFSSRNVIVCPAKGCGISLMRNQFSSEPREIKEFIDEKRVRKRIADIYTKKPIDFHDNLSEYSKYLEMKERLIWKLVSGTELEKAEAEKELKRYEMENHEQISLSRAGHTDHETEVLTKNTITEISLAKRKAEYSKADLLDKLKTEILGEIDKDLNVVANTIPKLKILEDKIKRIDHLKEQLSILRLRKIEKETLLAKEQAKKAPPPPLILTQYKKPAFLNNAHSNTGVNARDIRLSVVVSHMRAGGVVGRGIHRKPWLSKSHLLKSIESAIMKN